MVCFLVFGNPRKTPVTFPFMTKADVLQHEKNLRGEIFFVEGADGPYRDGSTAYGRAVDVGSSQSFNAGHVTFSFPSDKRFDYEASSYFNKSGEALIVARRFPVTENTNLK